MNFMIKTQVFVLAATLFSTGCAELEPLTEYRPVVDEERTNMPRFERNLDDCRAIAVKVEEDYRQVIQGAHPEPANLSCLQWMLGEHATIPADRGIFLAPTRRMHPAVCEFIPEPV